MTKALHARLGKLEQTAAPILSSPRAVHDWCRCHRIDTPEPLPGESSPQWLRRVPVLSLRAMLEARA